LDELLRLRTQPDDAYPEACRDWFGQALTQQASNTLDDVTRGFDARFVEALCQYGTGNTRAAVPADEVDFPYAQSETSEDAGRRRPKSHASFWASTETDEHKKERSSWADRADPLNLEEVTKRLLGVDAADMTFKGENTRRINRRLFPRAERCLFKEAGVCQQRLKRHSIASFAWSFLLWNRGEATVQTNRHLHRNNLMRDDSF
jgi:hypothetical protein